MKRTMPRILRHFLETVVCHGALDVTMASGATFCVGDATGELVAIRFADAAAERQLIMHPELALGELITDGRLEVTRGTIYDLLALVASNLRHGDAPGLTAGILRAGRRIVRLVKQWNTPARSSRNVAHHYDLDGGLYDLFLDDDRQYSCAYFAHPAMSLDEAQLAKHRHIAAKLMAEPGARVLDIGCGWGGLALYLAKYCSADVTGITLSREQCRIAQQRTAAAQARVDIRLQDYRALSQIFDRIVSVGMFEHVGITYYDTFFTKVRDLLADDGVMLLHAIGRMDGPGSTNPWIDKHIFPGGYAPALSEVLPSIERAGLIVTDIEILRLHYAETLRYWRQRFLQHRQEAIDLYDERFCRMWEFYLAGSEVAFRYSGLMVFQIQLAKYQGAVPLTRAYIAEREAQLEARENAEARTMPVAAE